MSNRFLLTVRGRNGTYSFVCVGDPAHLEEWRDDGLDVAEIAYVVPRWIADLGFTRAWCRAQDLWRLIWA